ncbi:MAG: type II secretion system protein [Rhodocyclaceae bacterium]|nr:type II secretion system protein [Rhodocyclaceae bacterium]
MARRRAAGFTYVALLLGVALLGSSLAWLGQSWQLASQREAERQLLFAGRQIRQALLSYQRSGPAFGQLPYRLDELLDDSRGVSVRRHLRRIYPDPVGDGQPWALITDEAGRVLGVHSRSRRQPLKRAGFASGEEEFEAAGSYADWRFAVRHAAMREDEAGAPPSRDQRHRYRPGAHPPTAAVAPDDDRDIGKP